MGFESSGSGVYQPDAVALGFKAQNFSALATTTASASPTQRIQATAIYLPAGTVVSQIVIRIAVAASGTAPTLAKLALLDKTSKVLAATATTTAAASWPTGPNGFSLTQPYTITAGDIYYCAVLVNGTWGTTQPTIITGSVSTAVTMAGFGSFPSLAFFQNGQTDFPAVGNSVGFTAFLGTPLWFAVA